MQRYKVEYIELNEAYDIIDTRNDNRVSIDGLDERALEALLNQGPSQTEINTLIEDAFKEGWQYGYDTTSVVGPEPDWKESETFKSLPKENDA
jgi:Tfp pilus assembly protein PilO